MSIEYNGGQYHGWQLQKNGVDSTVQGYIERALAGVANGAVRVHCAGRTDTGVHATSQIIHFDSPSDRSAKAWVMGGNAQLPDDIVINWAVSVDQDFHARFSASYRRYRYVIFNGGVRPAIMAGRVTWEKMPLDQQLMDREAQCLIGELDFSAFRAAGCQSRTSMRRMQKIKVYRRGQLLVIDIQSNAFLHHMVRNIAGVLIDVGSRRQPEGWTAQVLETRDRRCAGVTASPDGLYLIDVGYPKQYSLPSIPLGPLFLP